MKRIVFLLLIIFPSISFSQNEAAIWYFGENAGLDFNSGTPVVLTDGQLNTYEGCATISDATGNLLFYTNGVTVWDSTHSIMLNGTGLAGNSSSTQSAIIVQKPNNIDEYYIFTVDENANASTTQGGIDYSIVDMTLNGNLGGVVTKNSLLLANSYEKVTAVKHANNNDLWIITFVRDRFYAWLLDATGINAPVTTTAGISTENDASRGYLKTSIDGSRIASANFGTTPSMFLYDFNTSTGVVTNEQQLFFEDINDNPYGVEFSLMTQKLYVTTCQLNTTGIGLLSGGKLYQFDLLNANARVKIEDQNVYTRNALQIAIDGKIYRALSRVTTGQVPASGTNFLGVINNPELDGLASNYVSDAIDVTVGGTFPIHKVFEGLPPFVASLFLLPSISANDVCLGDVTQFLLNSTTPPTSIIWDFGDPTSGVNNTSILENPNHIFTSSGVFTVTATVDIGGIISVLTLDITIYDLPIVTSPVTLIQCDDDLDGIVDFNLEEANVLISSEVPMPTISYFLTQADAIANTITNIIVNPTVFSNGTAPTVWARIENLTNCFVTAQVDLQVITTNIPSNLMLTFNECDDLIDGDDANGITAFDFSSATNQILNALLPEVNLSVTYYYDFTDALAEQNSIDPTNYRNSLSPFTQQIVVRVDNVTNGCFGIGYHVTLNVDPVPQFDLLSNLTLCLNSTNSSIGIENPLGTYAYSWSDGVGVIGNTPDIVVSSEGTYTVTATDTNGTNCEKTKSIVVSSSPIGVILNFNSSNIVISDNSSNNTITVLTNNLPISTYEFALDLEDFQTSNIFENVLGGLHIVRIRDTENCLEASLEISLISIPNFFTPNNDGYNDTWHVTGIEFQPTSKVYVFDRFGKLIIVLDPLGPGWNGLYKGNPLPSTDYWYKVELEDGRVLKGHLSLIRK